MSQIEGGRPSSGLLNRRGALSADAPLPIRPRRRWHVNPVLPLLVIFVLFCAALFAPFITPWDPIKHDLIHSLMPPAWVPGGSMAHLLGTDSFGRDVFSRLLYGTRVTFLVVCFSLIVAVTIGTSVGLVAGYKGGKVDAVLMRLTDSLLTLPRILVAIIVAAAVGASFQTLVLVVGCLVWMSIARLVRAETKTVQNKEFVSYARAIGVPSWVIILRHILPNVFPVLIVVTTLEISHVIMLEAGLSFLGAGLPPPQPSWGGMIADGRSLISTGWWIALFPGLMIVVTILSCNGIGDWLRDFLDPKTRQRGY